MNATVQDGIGPAESPVGSAGGLRSGSSGTTGDIRKVSLWLGHQSLQTTEMYLRTDPKEKLDMLSEWHSPGLGKGRFTGVKDALMAMLSNV